MSTKKNTLCLLLLCLALSAGALSAGAGRTENVKQTLSSDSGASAAPASAAVPFSPEDVLWRGGMPAFDEASSTVYIPWECPEADDPLFSDASDSFSREILRALLPSDPRNRIELSADKMLEDPEAAMREGHAFSAGLVTPAGTARFHIVLTGLPVLCLQKTDDAEIVYKEEHDGRIRLLTPLQVGRGNANTNTNANTNANANANVNANTNANANANINANLNPDEEGFDTAGQTAAQTLRCTFHVRGNVSSTLDKKPYKISLKDAAGQQEKVSWLDLRRDDDWILNPLYTDSTRVREMTAYDLWEETAAFAKAPMASSRMRYVELFIDHAYQGLYGLMEPVDRKQLGLSPGDLLYKIDRWDREYPYLDLYDDAEQAEDLEICNENGLPCVEIRFPKSWDGTASWGPMRAFHTFSFRTADGSTLADAGLAPDMDSILSLSLFCAMTHAMDNNWKNSFLIAAKRASAAKTGTEDPYAYDLYRTIWDLNYVFGDVFVFEPENRYTAFDPDAAAAYTPFADSTYDFEAFLKADPADEETLQKALRAKWASWRAGGISADSIIALAERHMERLRESGALQREMERWPQDEDCGRALAEMEDWIRRRFAFLDAFCSPGE